MKLLEDLPDDARIYIRPCAFTHHVWDLGGRALQLAGGWLYFSAIDLITVHNGRRIGRHFISVDEIDSLCGIIPDVHADYVRQVMDRITARRGVLTVKDMALGFDVPSVVGILNTTTDSFSDGGLYRDMDAAVARAHEMVRQGAVIVDVGGESTRPGSEPADLHDELSHVLPIIERLQGGRHLLSVDTRKALVMKAALTAGAHIINDVSALSYDAASLPFLANETCPVVIMHHKGEPANMQHAPHYEDVLIEVYDWLESRVNFAVESGIARDRIIVDPGIGFGKNLEHNLALFNDLALFHGLGCPILIGASRKRVIGDLDGDVPANQRLGGSLALALAAVSQGVQLIRVHDVEETAQAVRVWQAAQSAISTI